jgi:5S rRNA maturation endonuclease (ribonuclease M5)
MTPFDLDFTEINNRALGLFPGLLYQWFPGGVLHGDEYDVKNPSRDDHARGSFRINTASGLWSDFATDQRGRSPISLYATFFCDGSHPEAAKQIARQIGMLADAPADPAIAKLIEGLKTKPVEDTTAEAGWTQIPAPSDQLPPLPANAPTWVYFTADNQVLGYVARINKAGGGKRFLPLTYWRNAEGREVWRHKQFVKPLPIYNRQALKTADRSMTVLVVEGEKAADAGIKHFTDMITVTWPQGSSSADKVDWAELRGRTVCLLPDHDEPGRKAMRQIAERLVKLDCLVYMGATEADRPVGWDIADGSLANEWPDEQTARDWMDRLSWTAWEPQGAGAAAVPKTPQQERLERALDRANGKGPQYAPKAVPVMPVEPLPIPLLAQFEAELSRRVHIAHPLASQQVALAVAANACARQGLSTSGDPCALSLALCAQSVGEVRPYLALAYQAFDQAGLRASVRQTRISTTNGLYKLLYTNPALLYLSAEYGMVVQFARRQPAGSQEQALNTMAELYDAADVSLDLNELGIKGFEGADQNVLRSPTFNLLALLSQEQMASVVKASELGRGALEQMQVVVLDEDRLVLNDPDNLQTGPLDPALIAMIRRLRGADTQGPLAITQGFEMPAFTTVRWAADMKTVYPALNALAEGATRAARPLLIAARANIRRVCTVLAMWANPDAPIITQDIMAWVARREVSRLTTFLAQFELLSSDDGKASTYQKVLAAIDATGDKGCTPKALRDNCWAFRSLDRDHRDELLMTMMDDGDIIAMELETFTKRKGRVYFAARFVNTPEVKS